MRPDEFIDSIKNAIMPDINRRMPDTRLGTVQSVSGTTAKVIIDGDTKATPMAAFCAASPGARALVLKQGTQFYLMGVTGDSISQDTGWRYLWVASSGSTSISIKYRRKFGHVTVRGRSDNYKSISNTAWTSITTLPEGFRPAYSVYGASSRLSTYDGSALDFRANPSGIIEALAPSAATAYWGFTLSFPV